jgi:protein-disulfide isomerase
MVLVVLALLVAACGPEMTTPTASEPEDVGAAPTTDTDEVASTEEAATAETPTGSETDQEEPSTGEIAVDSDDWHVLGAADAPVTIVEYADFQ